MASSPLLILPPVSSFHFGSGPSRIAPPPPLRLHSLHHDPPSSSFYLNSSTSSISSQTLIEERSNNNPVHSSNSSNPFHLFDPYSSPSKSPKTPQYSPFRSSLPHKSTESESSGHSARQGLKSAFGPGMDSDRDNRKHVRVNNDQLLALVQAYDSESMPSRESNHELAKRLGMSYRRVQVWFQNRRAKDRRVKASGGSKNPHDHSLEDDGSSLSDQSQEFVSAVSSLSQIGRGEESDRSEDLHESSLKDGFSKEEERYSQVSVPDPRKSRVDFLIS